MQLLEHFASLTLHPKNAQELKGLILQLAIQGKLTANWRKENPDIEPASLLLEKVKKEKIKLIKDKKIKKETPLPNITDNELPFKIYKTWSWTRLGNIGETNVGLTYKPSQIDEKGVPVLRSSNIQDGELCLKDLVRVNTDYREKDIIKEGDLLICARNGSRRLVGKCTIIGQIDEVMVFGAFMAIFRSDFNQYLQLFIQSPQYRSKLDGVETTTINQITQGNLKETLVPLPPLEEQKEIVRVVEILFKEVEQLEQLTVDRISLKEKYVTSALQQLTTQNSQKEWQSLQPHFKDFFTEKSTIKKLRETVLQLAVQGKLTADWRTKNTEVEHASELLKRIQKEKSQLIKDKKIKKESLLPAITKEEIPYELPEGWVWCRLGNYTHYGALDKYENKNATNETWVLELEDIEKESSKLLNKVRFTERNFKSTKSVFKSSDVIYGKLRPYLDKVIIADEDGVCTTEMIPIKSFSDCSPEYLRWFLKNPGFIEYANGSTHGMRMPRMGTDVAKNAIVSVPPQKEQKAIVEKVTVLMGLCDALEQEVVESKAYSEQLMQSVLREVFETNN